MWRRLTTAAAASDHLHLVLNCEEPQAGAADWEWGSAQVVWPPPSEPSAALLPGEADTQRAFRVDVVARCVYGSSQLGSPVDEALAVTSGAAPETSAQEAEWPRDMAQSPPMAESMPLTCEVGSRAAKPGAPAQLTAPLEQQQASATAEPQEDNRAAQGIVDQQAVLSPAPQPETDKQLSSPMQSGHIPASPLGVQPMHSCALDIVSPGAGMPSTGNGADQPSSSVVPPEAAKKQASCPASSAEQPGARSALQPPLSEATRSVPGSAVALPPVTRLPGSREQQDTSHSPQLPPSEDVNTRPSNPAARVHGDHSAAGQAHSKDSLVVQVRPSRFADVLAMKHVHNVNHCEP